MTPIQSRLLMMMSRNPATWNPSDKSAGATLSNGNLTATNLGYQTTVGQVRANKGKIAGKWYFELKVAGTSNSGGGIVDSGYNLSTTGLLNTYSPLVYADSASNILLNGVSQAGGVAMVQNDILGVAVDLNGLTVQFFKNNVSFKTLAITGSTTYFPFCSAPSAGNANSTCTANFGATAQTYSPPSGFNPGWY